MTSIRPTILAIIVMTGLLFIGFTAARAIWVFVFLFIAALACTILFRDRLQSFFLLATSVLAGLCLIEAAGMIFEVHLSRLDAEFGGPRLILGFGPVRSGRFHVRSLFQGKVIYDVHYTIDERLLRKTEGGLSGDGVSFFGDSFVFGQGIEDSQTLPQQFADLEGRAHPVFNLGYMGYSAAQVLAEMQAGMFDDLLMKSRLFVEFVAPWHADRTACKASFVRFAPRYKQIDGKVVFQGYCERATTPLAYFAAYRTFFLPHISSVTKDDVTNLVAVADETIRMAREKYKKPIVIYYMRDPGYLKHLQWTDDQIMNHLRSAGAKVLDYTIDDEYTPKYSIPGDMHPTPLANEIRAKRLLALLRQEYPQLEPAAVPQPAPLTSAQ